MWIMTAIPYWVWLIAGLLLFITEMISATFFIAFFGIGALIVGTLTALGLVHETGTQFLIFGLSSILLLVLFRKTIKEKFFPARSAFNDNFAGDTATAETEITNLDGSLMYKGALWAAYRADGKNTPIPAGLVVDIIGTDGIKLKVKPHTMEE
jgi:membrane protein implicated in regulation of membrane protease activity